MEMTYPKIALVAEGPNAEELRRIIALVGDVVEAPNLQGALEQNRSVTHHHLFRPSTGR
jgi:hypothetical protein